MGRIGYSSVTLTDLTETIPVTLVLETSLPQNIQTKVGNLYTPDFSKNGEELIITPSLFRGKEEIYFKEHSEYLKPDGRTSGFLYYEIGSTIYKWEEGKTEGTYVDDEGRLHYNSNLTGNIMVEAYIEDFEDAIHSYTLDLVQATNPISILFLEEGNDNYFATIECEGGREHFEDTNANAILMTAKLYRGLDNLLAIRPDDFEIKWDRLSDGNTSADSTSSQLTVIRSEVTNRDLFTCEIKDKATGITYTAQQFIYDFTDQYNCVITYDKPLLLSEENTEVNLSAAVWHKNKRLEGETGYKLSYRWMVVGEKDGEDKNLSGNESTIKISSNDINIPQKQAFTVLCQVLHTDSAGSQYIIANGVVTFQWIPSYSVRISPKDIFVVTGSDGSYQGNANKQYIFNFQLIDKQGNLITFDTTDSSIESISTGTNSDGTIITFKQNTTNKWDFTGTITLSNALWNSTDGSRAYEFTYVYYGQQFTEEVNIIKNKTGAQGIQGPQGSQGFSGYTIDLSNEFHVFAGGEGQADTDQDTSCKILAHYGDQKRDIEKITVGSTSGTIIYQKGGSIGEKIYTIPNSKGYLFISTAVGSNNNEVKVNIRTNKSTVDSEKDYFLTGIEPINFYITIAGQSSNLTFLKTFTYTINYNGKSYRLIPSHDYIKYSEAEGIYEPSEITVSATMRQESGESVTYSGAKIIYSFDGDNWKNYTDSGISGYANLQNIYLRLYSSQATFSSNPTSDISSNIKYLLDTETIPVLTSLEGYQIGGENLLRWTKDLPIENGKWTRTKDSDSYLMVEKDGDFSVLKYFVTDTSTWKNFKSPRAPLEPEYIGKKLCFSCFVYSDDWSTMSSSFHLGISAYKSYNSIGRDAYKNVGIFNNKGESNSNLIQYEGVWENKKWIKIWTVFSFSDLIGTDFDTNEDGVKDEQDKADPVFPHPDYKYYSFDLFLKDKGQLKIKKPKLELGNVPTAWSASPYDITYEEVNGLNLISNNNIDPYNFVLKAGEEIRLTASLLNKQTLHTLSWFSSLSSTLNSFGWVAKRGDNTILDGGNFSINNNNFQYTFSDYEEDWNLFFYGGTYNTETKEITYYNYGEILFSSIKLEKGTTATSFILNTSQINQIVETSTNNLSKTIFDLPIISGSQSSEINFTSSQDFIDFVNNTNNLKAQVEENTSGLSVWDEWYDFNGNTWELYKNSVDIVVAEDGGPFIKIQAVTASGEKLTNNYLKLEENILGFYSNNTLVASMSQSALTIDYGILKNVRAKENFYIGDLRFRITDSGVGIVWS